MKIRVPEGYREEYKRREDQARLERFLEMYQSLDRWQQIEIWVMMVYHIARNKVECFLKTIIK